MTVIRLDGDAFGRRIGIHVVLLLSLSDGAAVKEEEGRNKLAANTIIKLSLSLSRSGRQGGGGQE